MILKKNKKHPKDNILKYLDNILLFSKETPYESYIQAEIRKIKTQLEKLK